ncbi:MAG TPA: hypothetical protein VHZ73_12240 [Vicinamibacterales bacterium]|nr:hypothetical protein [Vicinamibacterales bacterium]
MDVKLLLKRGALLAAANWPLIAIQFAAETTFQVLLAVPVIGGAILVAAILGGNVSNLLQGRVRDMAATVASSLTAEPIALVSFMTAFGIVLAGGSMLVFLVKGGVIEVLLKANSDTGPIEREPLTLHGVQGASRFSLSRFTGGCARLFKAYTMLGLYLTGVYVLTGALYVVGAVYTFDLLGTGGLFVVVWAPVTLLLLVWISFVNVVYALLQLVIAAENVGIHEGLRIIGGFVRARIRPLGALLIVVFLLLSGAWVVSILAWSGVGLVAFVPLVGLAVFPLQIVALLMRGLVYEYIGLTALGAYLSLYRPEAGDARASERGTAPATA